MSPQTIKNVTGTGSCSLCDDVGLVALDRVDVFDGHEYASWAAPCSWCEEGERRRISVAKWRRSWRDQEVAA
jgi:hypothetical protein